MKKSIPDMSNHDIYREEAVGLKSCKFTLKIMIFVNMCMEFGAISWKLGLKSCKFILKIMIFVNMCMEFGAISWKLDILSITASLEFESKNSFAHVWHI